MAFWTSLPGVLTGLAAVVAAAATLVALFMGTDGTLSAPADVTARRAAEAAPSGAGTTVPGTGAGDCLRRYFAAIPRDRIATVEAGTLGLEVITASQPKAGAVGLRFASSSRSIGAMRLAFYSSSAIFKIESVVDERCHRIEDYSNVVRGGDRNVLQNNDTVRLAFDGDSYDLHANGGTSIRLNFVAVVR